jgi:hypothetical protein
MINNKNLEDFISIYNSAVKSNAVNFIFEGKQVITEYAYFILNYLQIGKFDENKIFTKYA